MPGTGIDFRVMTLKRWNLPQRSSIFERYKNGGSAFGGYVVFQNYHFIDIEPVKYGENANAALPKAYAVLKSHRDGQYADNAATPDVYVQQSMVLFGDKTAFWDSGANELYITMIQLYDEEQPDYKKLEKSISNMLKSRGIKEDDWCLYYSLDFCDIVLFARNIDTKGMQDVLWSFCPDNARGLKCIRDTVTTYAVGYNYLLNNFREIADCPKKVAPTAKDENLSLNISLGIRSLDGWNEVSADLKAYIHKYGRRTTGRYDISIHLQDITKREFFRILYMIDKTFEANPVKTTETKEVENAHVFSGYEALLMESEKLSIKSHKNSRSRSAFKEQGEKALNKSYDAYYTTLKDSKNSVEPHGYAAEIKRSLVALLKSGFSEEFVLSIFYSFAEYLRIVKARYSGSDTAPKIDHLYAFQREYFQALSMLTLCTMHSEKQFIQAPAFNSNLCDVPPKLLAFYTAVACYTTRALDDEPKCRFSFLISPDFRQDIHVKPISFSDEPSGKLSIIHLNEEMFYSPEAVIYTMCHEIAHHVGGAARKRESRAKHVFRTIGAFLLAYTFTSLTDKKELSMTPLITALGDAIMHEFESWQANRVKERRYYAANIVQFFEDTNYLQTMFLRDDFMANLEKNLFELFTNNDTPDELLTALARIVDDNVYAGHLIRVGERGAACHIVAHNVVAMLCGMMQTWRHESELLKSDENPPLGRYYLFCQHLLLAYSEAYADLRMVQLLKVTDMTTYTNVMEKNTRFRSDLKEDFQFNMRRNAVAIAADLSDKHLYTRKKLDKSGKAAEKIALDELVAYLRECGEVPLSGNEGCEKRLYEHSQDMSANTASELFKNITGAMFEYRDWLSGQCRDILEESTDGAE